MSKTRKPRLMLTVVVLVQLVPTQFVRLVVVALGVPLAASWASSQAAGVQPVPGAPVYATRPSPTLAKTLSVGSVGVAVGVAVAVEVAVFVGVLVRVGVRVGVDVRVAVGVRVAVAVRVDVGVRVSVGVGVLVRVNVGVKVRVGVRVTVAVRVAVAAANIVSPSTLCSTARPSTVTDGLAVSSPSQSV
ncbi:MAG: hypothetical protein U0641_01130 [Anaerolineae bacterium]